MKRSVFSLFFIVGLVVASAFQGLALTIYTDNPMGNLFLVSPAPEPKTPSPPSGWNDVPGLSTAVYSHKGDNLKMTVTAEIDAPASVWLRALVDGKPASPTDVVYKLVGDLSDGVRSFTFVKQNLSGGRHIVQIQWLTWPGTVAQIGGRTLSVNSAAPAWGTGRLAVVAAPSSENIVKTTPTWEDIPNLSTTLTTDATSDFEITFSAETGADGGRFFARALIDGGAISEVLFDNAESWARSGTRSFTFVGKGVAAGTHTVTMQWYAADSGALIHVGDRTLTVFASPATTTGGGLVATAVEAPPVWFSGGIYWEDVPTMSGWFTTDEPSTNVQITFSAEVAGHLFIRSLIDGQPTQPEDVLFVSNGSELRAQSFVFIAKNVLPGTHSVKIQARADASATGQLNDRSMSVLFKRRHGVDFAQPYAAKLKPRHGTFPLLVICFDPMRPGHVRPTEAQVINQHLGDDGGANVRGWYRENTGRYIPTDMRPRLLAPGEEWKQKVQGNTGRYVPAPITFLGCSDGAWFEAPPDRQGWWYWETKNWPLMWEDAIKAADPYFDFHQYDRNGDYQITGDELAVNILRPQNFTDGTHRQRAVAVDGISTPLTFNVLDVYFSADDMLRRPNVGLIAHEAAHGALGAADMYMDNAICLSGYTTEADYYSLMDETWRATHFDPFHKLKSGFLTPDVVEINGWVTQTVRLAAVEEKNEVIIIYHPERKDREYFMIENRWGGTSSAPNYDFPLPAYGVAVWHIVEDLELANEFRPPGTPCFEVKPYEWGRLSIRLLGVLSSSGASKELKWADGTSSLIKVTAKDSPAEVVKVEIAKLP